MKDSKAYQAIAPQLATYKASGALTVSKNFSARKLHAALRQGNVVMAGMETHEPALSHMVAIARPNQRLPAVVFDPGELLYYPSLNETIGSMLDLYTKDHHETTFYTQSGYTISPPDR